MTERITVVSADGHVGCSVETMRPYVDPAYRDRLDDVRVEEEVIREAMSYIRAENFPPEVLDAVDDRGVLRERAYMDVYRSVAARIGELDAEGVAAEIVLDGGEWAYPWFAGLNRPYPLFLQAAGARAFNRWVADLISESEGRIYGNLVLGPGLDLEASADELRWAKEHGFVSVTAPRKVAHDAIPLINDPYWEPFWAACAEIGLAVNLHAGWGRPQGFLYQVFVRGKEQNAFQNLSGTKQEDALTASEYLRNAERQNAAAGDDMMEGGQKTYAEDEKQLTVGMGQRQALWQLMLNGVFDRNPGLKLVLTEVRADWVPATLAYLDERFEQAQVRLELRPSEYFERNVGVTPSAPHYAEVQIREQIGVDRFMFGTDMPHREGTWPNTRNWIKHAFRGVPEDQVRKILGENAIRFYEMDRTRIAEVASRIGPTPDEVFAGVDLGEPVLANFNHRAGYRKPIPDVHQSELSELVDADLAQTNDA